VVWYDGLTPKKISLQQGKSMCCLNMWHDGASSRHLIEPIGSLDDHTVSGAHPGR
jgi:hypothetical protein